MGALIDAEVLIAAESGRVKLLDLLPPGEPVAVAAPTASELLEIVERTGDAALATQRASFVERLLERVDVVAFDGPAARVRAKFHEAHADPRALDVAAIAMSRGWSVVTGGKRYDAIPGLQVVHAHEIEG